MIAPILDARRFELVASVLRPAVNELLRVSDEVDRADRQALVDAALVAEWLITLAQESAVIFRKLDERVAAIFLQQQPPPDQSESERAEQEMRGFSRPPMPARLGTPIELSVTTAALQESEQILRWSCSTVLLAAADRVAELREWLL